MTYLQTAVVALAALLSIGLALFVAAKGWRRAANLSLAAALLALGLLEACHLLSYLRPEEALRWVGLASMAELTLPPLWFAATALLAAPESAALGRRWKIIALGLSLSALAIAPAAWNALAQTELGALEPGLFLIGPPGVWFNIYLLLASILVLVNAENLLRASGGSVRWQMKFAVLAVAAIFLTLIFVASQRLVDHLLRQDFFPLQGVSVALSVTLLAYAIARRGLLDARVFISRYVVYNSIAVMALGLYLFGVGLVAQLIRHLGMEVDLFWRFLAVLVTAVVVSVLLLSERVRRAVRLFISRHFYENKYDYRAEWLALSRRLAGQDNSPQAIARAAVGLILESMYVRQAGFWLKERERFSVLIQEGFEGDSLELQAGHPLLARLHGGPEPLAIDEAVAPELAQAGVDLVVPIVAGGEVLGFIGVGRQFLAEDFKEDDHDLLVSLSAQVAGALAAAGLSEKLAAVRSQEALHRLSTFIMHDVKNSVAMLSLALQNAPRHLDKPEFQKDLLATVSGAVERMRGLMSRLSSLPRGIELKLGPVDLVQLIEGQARMVSPNGQAGPTLRCDLPAEGLPELQADAEQVGKVLTNLLVNAFEASPQGAEVSLKAYCEGDWAVVEVSDQGPGISPEFLRDGLFKPFHTTKRGGLGIGLFQSRLIAEGHGGRLEVQSIPGAGSIFRLKLPAAGR